MNQNSFLDTLKSFLADNNNIPNYIPVWAYYHIICSSPDAMKPILDDCAVLGFDIHYDNNRDEYDRYTEGTLKIYLQKLEDNDNSDWENQLSYHYEISLDVNDRMTGYCSCKPTDEGFDFDHKCCGAGCDWCEPCISVTRVEGLGHSAFSGYEHDMWKLERDWKGIREETKENKLMATLNYYEGQIKQWEEIKANFITENNLAV